MNYRYKTVKHPETGKSVLKHRFIMEEELGRPLRDDEHVHHINGDSLDNRVANLEVLAL